MHIDESSLIDFQQAKTRERIASHPFERQRATAMFVLSTAQLAHDLDKMVRLIEIGGVEYSEGVKDAMAQVESKIRDCYRDSFGSELGSIKLDGN